MKIALIRGDSLNKWEMQSFEPLTRVFDITACGSTFPQYATENIDIPIRRFKPDSAALRKWGLPARVATKLNLLKRPKEFLIGLEEWLNSVSLSHAVETHIPFSEQAVNAKLRYGTPVVLTCWETLPYAYEDDPVVRARRKLVRDHADLFLATTQRAARALQIEGVSADRIQVIMPGVDVCRFAPEDAPGETRKAWGIGRSDISILFIGRLIREKGVRELIVAFGIALRSLPTSLSGRCTLLIAGNGEQRNFVENLIASSGYAAQIRIVGGMDYMEIHRLHQAADIFVLPSIATPYWEEQYGMVLAEAMACGTAVISTTTGGIPEVVGEAGLLVPPLEADALAEALVTLIRDETVRAECRRRSRERALMLFDSRKTAQRFADAYRSVPVRK